ncbi:MAG: TonB-dependent receptor [Sphingopyxis granuli]
MRYRDLRGALASSVAVYAVAIATPAMAQAKSFNVPAQSAATGIPALAEQADIQILVSEEAVRGKTIRAIKGSMSVDRAVRRAAADAGLRVVSSDGRTWTLAPAMTTPTGNTPTSDTYSGNEIVVTAQKRVESAQDVPIAISAFSEQALQEQKIEGGFDLLKAIPNVTFSKGNFTSYNFSIRGVGTKAVSATTDPGVAVAFNNSTLIHNRLFEQEYLDVERVEVLRGPQGTLYGRNATSGVINIISRRPKLGVFEGSIKGEVGNYDTRRMSAMLNVPLVDDVLAVRLAGSMTSRDGFDYNSTTKNRVNGRDLWTGRVSAKFEPSDNFRANFVWERFSEDDNRSRTGKQLCHRDDGPTHVGSVDLADNVNMFTNLEQRRALFGQGCKAGGLYDDAAFGTPNGLSYSFILGTIALREAGTGIGNLPGALGTQSLLKPTDPYGGMMQSSNLREIASLRDPIYRARADLFEFNMEFDVAPSLTITSQTVFNNDNSYSFQDYNRFNSLPAFNDTSVMTRAFGTGPSQFVRIAPGGIFCDPQVGCSDTIAGFDISSSKSKQFNQEIRIQSSFDGPLNFSFGANYTKFSTIN